MTHDTVCGGSRTKNCFVSMPRALPTIIKQTPVPVAAPVPGKDSQQSLLRIKVESPQFRSVHWYECVAYEDGRLPVLLARCGCLSNVDLAF